MKRNKLFEDRRRLVSKEIQKVVTQWFENIEINKLNVKINKL